MKIIKNSNTKYNLPICLALGFFDGVHLGHRTIIEKSIAKANELGVGFEHEVKSGVLTFSNNPLPESKLIYTFHDRLVLFESLKLDCCFHFELDKRWKSMNANQFLEFLIANFNIHAFICGVDYRFGKDSSGDVEHLKKFAYERGIDVEVISQQLFEKGKKISSTIIRKCIQSGEIEKANALLGDNYFMKGEVVKGHQKGRKMGLPTLNLNIMPDIVQLKEGVYRTETTFDEKKYSSLTHIGKNKTFNSDDITCETHVLNHDLGELYSKEIKVEFISRLRDTIKFNSPEKLANYIKTIDMQ
ncbi:MAG: riboflavin biosynthesis protein RibF [Firmicutes bacterium]|nr:riboflavin biosynthesis protein RibF [Bacillota bacterium]